MMKKSAFLLLISLFVGQVFASPLYTQEDPEQFEVQSYLGRWYDWARTPNNFQDNTPTRDGVKYSACFNSTADYKLKKEGVIDLVNTCYRKSPDGKIVMEDIDGKAKVAKHSNGTRIGVAFGGVVARFFQRVFTGFRANYWIYAVGEKNDDGLYSWALVSGKKKDYIFVLTRTLEVEESVRQDILVTAEKLGLPVEKLVFNSDR